jgi:hypothetical protein
VAECPLALIRMAAPGIFRSRLPDFSTGYASNADIAWRSVPWRASSLEAMSLSACTVPVPERRGHGGGFETILGPEGRSGAISRGRPRDLIAR